jgi:hypothetical protein
LGERYTQAIEIREGKETGVGCENKECGKEENEATALQKENQT